MLAWNGKEYVDVCKLTPHPIDGQRQIMGDMFRRALTAFLADGRRHYYRASDRSDLEAFPLEMSLPDKGMEVFVPLADHIWRDLVDWVEDRMVENHHYGAEFPACYALVYDLTDLGGKWMRQ